MEFQEIQHLFYSPNDDNNEIILDTNGTNNDQKLRDKLMEGLCYVATYLDFSADRINKVKSVYDAYLNGYIKDLISNDELNIFNWGTLVSNENLKDLADIALRLEPATCSEASAERAISAQRIVMQPNRDKSKQDLVDARLTLLRSDIDES